MMRRTHLLLAAAAVLSLGAGGLAMAQPGPRGGTGAPVYDPAQLPQVKGTVAQYSLNPMGMIDGLLLADGTEVHVPPFVSTQLVFAVKPGDAVTIHGLKAKDINMIAARSITNDATGVTVVAMMPRHGGAASGMALEAEGQVTAVLHTPRGEANGVRLADGTQVRMPPGEAAKLVALLQPGKTVAVRGVGYAGPLGRVIAAQQIGPDKANLTAVAGPKPGMGGHGMRGHGRSHEDGPGRHFGPGRHGGQPPAAPG